MALPESFIADLKLKNPIGDVIGSYIPLKRVGRNVKCKCPFHNETDASFVVYPDSQSFYCFGCGAGGDVITFVMKLENLDYMSAVGRLADRANIPLPEQNNRDEKQRQGRKKVIELNKAAARYFFACLVGEGGKEARQYLKGRGISPQSIKKFGMGYAPAEWDGLTNHLKKSGFSEEDIVLAGLSVKGKKGSLYDCFRHRVMIPIINIRGEVIGFGGRALADDGPKYLNSADTPAFKKSRNLFAMNLAKLSKEPYFILTEGYLDVIALHQGGVTSAVATLGTALTKEQAYLLVNYKQEMILCYDADAPGQTATKRALHIFDQLPGRVRVLRLTGAKDPDEFIGKFGAAAFSRLVENSLPSAEYLLLGDKEGLNMATTDGQVMYLKRAAASLSSLADPGEQMIYAGKVASELSLDKEVVLAQMKAAARGEKSATPLYQPQASPTGEAPKPEEVPLPPYLLKAENELIRFFYLHPEQIKSLPRPASAADFLSQKGREIARVLLTKAMEEGEEISIEGLRQELSEVALARLVFAINVKDGVDIGQITIYLNLLKEEANHQSKTEIRAMEKEEYSAYMKRLLQAKGKK